MKSLFVAVFLAVIAFFLLCSVASFGQKAHHVIAIGSYNCENFFDTLDDPNKKDNDFTPTGSYHYTSEVYKEKMHNIATVISKIGTDVTPDGAAICGLVEIENDNVLSDLVRQPELAKRNYNYVWYPTPDERGISTAMLYNPKYFKVISSKPLRVPLETLGQTRPTRDILYVCGMLAGDTVHILVNHWPSKSGGEAATTPGRKLAARIDKVVVDSIMNENPAAKIILMGDLNDNPTSEPVKEVLQVEAEKKHVELNDIYNPWVNMYKQGYGTENYRGDWNLIDQIMVSGGLVANTNQKWQYHNAEIYSRDFLVHKIGKDKGLPHRSFTIAQVWDNGYSDHFPVLIYLVQKVK